MNEQEMKRLSDCEVLVSKYHDQLQKFMDQVVNYNRQIISKDDFEEVIRDLKKNMRIEFEMLRSDSSDKFLLHSNLEKRVEDLSQLVSRHHELLNRHNIGIEKLFHSVQDNDTHFASHEKKLASLSEKMPNWEKISLIHEQFKKDVFNLLGQHHEKHEVFNERIENFQRMLNKEINRINSFDSEHIDREAKLAEMRSQIYDRMDEIRSSIDSKVSSAKAELSSQMQQIQVPPQLPIPEKLVEVPDDIRAKVESMLLDLSNAKAKSDVNEMQLKIFEKKLDNIYLLLKKNELTK